MNYYIDIEVLPDLEIGAQHLLNNVFAKCHRVISQHGEGNVGVSFPQYKKMLGHILRLHGSATDLNRLMALNWLAGLKDYCQCSAVAEVPANARYRTVSRYQRKSAHNKRKRSIAKGWLTQEQAMEAIPDTQQHNITYPFIALKSLSNHNPMRIYIKLGELQNEPHNGTFGSYGLSSKTTIPWF